MGKHTKRFTTHSEYTTFKNSGDYIKPNVSYCENENNLHYSDSNIYADQYLTIESLQDSILIIFLADDESIAKTIYVSTDDGQTWTEKTSSTNGTKLAVLNAGDKLLLKGNNASYGNSSGNNNHITSEGGLFNIMGNIMSLLYGDNFKNQTTLSAGYVFSNLFEKSGCVSAENLFLPSMTLTESCYDCMFYDCNNLIKAPKLPATIIGDTSYSSMFYGCTSLITAPKLPATTLNYGSYFYMFYGCTSLITAPKLPATTLANYCYNNMFYGCTSLINAPKLPATTLADSCYNNMFQDCTSLINAPKLPATTLASNCYNNMFNGCTSLTTAPALPATTLAYSCYASMFKGCTSLTIAPALPATTLTTYCYRYMFQGCTSLTSAPALSATTLTTYCYANMFQGCINLTAAPELPAITLKNNCYKSMFQDCTRLNYIKAMFTTSPSTTYTDSWVTGVSSTGTFVKNSAATWNVTGKHGIPTGWTVETASA